jgi:hypothetical protein
MNNNTTEQDHIYNTIGWTEENFEAVRLRGITNATCECCKGRLLSCLNRESNQGKHWGALQWSAYFASRKPLPDLVAKEKPQTAIVSHVEAPVEKPILLAKEKSSTRTGARRGKERKALYITDDIKDVIKEMYVAPGGTVASVTKKFDLALQEVCDFLKAENVLRPRGKSAA